MWEFIFLDRDQWKKKCLQPVTFFFKHRRKPQVAFCVRFVFIILKQSCVFVGFFFLLFGLLFFAVQRTEMRDKLSSAIDLELLEQGEDVQPPRTRAIPAFTTLLGHLQQNGSKAIFKSLYFQSLCIDFKTKHELLVHPDDFTCFLYCELLFFKTT